MGFIFFPHKNRINGKYINVIGERFDLIKIDENEIKFNSKEKKVYDSEEEFIKYCDLRKFEEVKRGKK